MFKACREQWFGKKARFLKVQTATERRLFPVSLTANTQLLGKEVSWVGVCPSQSLHCRVLAGCVSGKRPACQHGLLAFPPLLLQDDLICIGDPNLHELPWLEQCTGMQIQSEGAKTKLPPFHEVFHHSFHWPNSTQQPVLSPRPNCSLMRDTSASWN